MDKKHREILSLRDPINMNLFAIFLTNAGNLTKQQKYLKQA